MARLKSEHVARVLDAGQAEDGTPFLVMELLDGEDLGEVLKRLGRLPFEQAVDFVLQACEGLAEAHSVGIVHRDLKPGNLFLAKTSNGASIVKLVDFGISKLAASPGEATLTAPQSLLGSPHYMAPEQIRAPHDVDGRADIYSLGAVLFRLVSGQRPFERDSVADLMIAVLQHSPRSLASLVPGLPPDLAAIVAQCLEREPDKRFATVIDLADALARLLGRTRSLLPVPHQSLAPHPARAPVPPAPTEQEAKVSSLTPAGLVLDALPSPTVPALRPKRAPYARLILGLLALSAVIATGAFVVASGRSTSVSSRISAQPLSLLRSLTLSSARSESALPGQLTSQSAAAAEPPAVDASASVAAPASATLARPLLRPGPLRLSPSADIFEDRR